MAKVVLVANTDWYLYNFRLSLAEAVRKQGHDVLLVSPSGPYVHHLEQAGFRWQRWEVGRRSLSPLAELPAILALQRLYRQEKADLVHHCTIKPVIYGSLAARLASVPAVVNAITGRGYVYQREGVLGLLLRGVTGGLYRLAFGHANYAAIFENDTDRQFFIQQRFVHAQRTFLVEGVGVDPQRYVPAPEPVESLVVLPGRLLWAKGIADFVEAARLLRSRSQALAQVRFALVGDPDPGNPTSIPQETLRAWVEQGLVEWWGFRTDMPAVFQGAQIVTLPSIGEGVPTVLLEAAACGRPIVATDVQGCRDVVQHGVNGLLVPPNDPAALAQALETLLVDPARRAAMGAAGRKLVLEKFTNEKVNQATLAVYRSLGLTREISTTP